MKGMELSINFLVVFILSVVMLALGITLLYKFFGNVQELDLTITERERQNMLRLMDDGSKSRIAPQLQEIGRTKSAKALFAVHNIITGEPRTFKVEMQLSYSIEANSEIRCEGPGPGTGCCEGQSPPECYEPYTGDDDDWIVQGSPLPIRHLNTEIFPIVVKVPRVIKGGTYTFNAQAMYEDPIDSGNWVPYDTPRVFSIVVP
jgi:hypothetical protein